MASELTAKCPTCGCEYEIEDVGQLVRCDYCDDVFTRFNNWHDNEMTADSRPSRMESSSGKSNMKSKQN